MWLASSMATPVRTPSKGADSSSRGKGAGGTELTFARKYEMKPPGALASASARAPPSTGKKGGVCSDRERSVCRADQSKGLAEPGTLSPFVLRAASTALNRARSSAVVVEFPLKAQSVDCRQV